MADSLAPEDVAMLKRLFSFIGYIGEREHVPIHLRADAVTIKGELYDLITRHNGANPPRHHVATLEMPMAAGCVT